MRLISQNMSVDVLYENVVLVVDDFGNSAVIKAYDDFSGIDYICMGKYSTRDKANTVMEMIRERYLSRMELDGGYDVVNQCYIQPNYWVLPKVFQFPADDEVEA